MSRAYYNERDPYAAAWLRNLIAEGLIAPGDVDERDVRDVVPTDLRGFAQCHWFAGIGGWSYALRLAGWSDATPAWTGSAPCQPFSAAGRGGGFDDERHLWPAWFWLISQCRPPVVFGEQVASKAGLGWFDLVSADLEGAGYAVGAADLCAAGIGAPHLRQRLWFVADAAGERRGGREGLSAGRDARGQDAGRREGFDGPVGVLEAGVGVGHADANGHGTQRPGTEELLPLSGCATGRVADALPAGRAAMRPVPGRGPATGRGGTGELALSEHGGRERGRPAGSGASSTVPSGAAGVGQADASSAGLPPREREAVVGAGRRSEGGATLQSGGSPVASFWSDAEWLPCRDGKARPVEPGSFPLANGLPAGMGCGGPGEVSPYRTITNAEGRPIGQAPWRVGMLRGYGNAIAPEVAALFVSAYREAH